MKFANVFHSLLLSFFLALIFSVAGQVNTAWSAVPSVVSLPDTDGDTFPEVGILIRNAADTKNRSYVMDANSGPSDYVIKLGIPPELDPLFQVEVPDLNASGSPELAMLGVTYVAGVVDTVRVIIKDTSTGSSIVNMGFDKDFPPVAMAVVEYPAGHTASNVGIAVLGRRLPTGGPGTSLTKVSVRDAVSGAIITNTYYMQTFTPIAMAVLPDYTGAVGGLTDAPEIAVLGLRDADVTWGGVVSVIITDVGVGAANNGWVTFIGFDANVNPVDMVILPDMNGNGSDEIAVLGVNNVNDNITVSIREPIKDINGISATINTLVFPVEYPPVGMKVVPDMTANGIAELAVYGLGDPSVGDGSGVLDRTKVYIRDASAPPGDWIGTLTFGEAFPTTAMVVVDNYADVAPYTYAPEIAVLGKDGSGTMMVTTKDILYNDVKIDSFYVPPQFQISVTVSGLVASGLVLQNNGGDDLAIEADGVYTFATLLPDDSAYNVTVSNQPVDYICGVNNGIGWVDIGNVTIIFVTCAINFSNVSAIEAGEHHSIVLKTDGTVWTWGRNNYGQLGNGTQIDSNVPVQVCADAGCTAYLTGASAVAAGAYHTVALKTDGTAWTWGYNYDGQLGDGTTNDSSTPVQEISGMTNASEIAAGGLHSLVVKTDGTLWSWGNNYSGQLGDGTTTNSSTPVQEISGMTNASAIAGGLSHTVALKTDGTVWTWGYNYYGQLGNGTWTDSLIPVQVPGMTNVSAIAAGMFYSLALKSDGTVWGWGRNDSGQLGDGTWTIQNAPVPVTGMTNVVAIAAGEVGHHTVALKADGTVWTWGNNYYGQLGDGTTTPQNAPVPVLGMTNVFAIAAGGYHTLALKTDGTVWAWGLNDYGQLGDGTWTGSLIPVLVGL